MYPRKLDMVTLSKQKSFFLFGPRSTGKTTLLRTQFPGIPIINLLTSSAFLPLAANPAGLADIVKEQLRIGDIIIIDEIQKLPVLLDEVHNLIESNNVCFILTGSSARKLKSSGVNLLAGRAWQANLYPLVSSEIIDFDLNRYLKFGGLPQVYSSEHPKEELNAYVSVYLKEEIQSEALVQNLPQFSRFLKTAAFLNAEQLNYANVASDAGIPASTVKGYFSILEDTFTGFLLESRRDLAKRKAVATAKFYFFDTGVANFLRGVERIYEGGSDYGKAFEQFIAMELRAWISYNRTGHSLCYWRTQTGIEVDFIVGDSFAVEAKASKLIHDKHLKGLRKLKEENVLQYYFVVSLDPNNKETEDGIRCLHWQRFLELLWSNTLISIQ